MNSNLKTRKAKAGLLLIASPRFKTLGEGLRRGTYAERKDADVKKILATMEFLDVVFPGIVYDKEEAVEAMDRFYMEKVDFVIAEFLFVVRGLRVDTLPARHARGADPLRQRRQGPRFVSGHVGRGRLHRLPLRRNARRIARSLRVGAPHGTPAREGRDGFARGGHRADPPLSLRRPAPAPSSASRTGLLANYNEAMWSTYIDPYDLFTKLGPEIRFLPYSTYGEMIDAVSDEELQAYCGELTSRYKMMDDVARDKFEASVRASIGLQKMAERSDIDVMVFNDIDRAMFELVGLRAGFYHPWFNDNCSVLVPEADIGAGLITYLLKLISGKNVNFLEPFHIESDYGTFAGGHAGPNDHNDPAWQQNVVIARDVRFAKTSYKYAGAPFAWYRISPGAQDNGAAGGVRRTLQAGRHAGRFARRRSHPGHLFAQHLPPSGSRRAALRRDLENRHHAAFRHR